MTPEFLQWYELNERRFDGSAMQAAWLAWEARGDAREVAAARLAAMPNDESSCELPTVADRSWYGYGPVVFMRP